MPPTRAVPAAVLLATVLAVGSNGVVARWHVAAPSLARTPIVASSIAPMSSASPSPSTALSPEPVSVRTAEIPGARLISMSPDGRSIVGVVPLGNYSHGKLCVYDVATLAQRSCADLSGLDAGLMLREVTWSPDSLHLAFTELAFQVLRDGDLWLMDVATGALLNLDDDRYRGPWGLTKVPGTITEPMSPTFTPDGRAVTYARTTIVEGALAGNDIATVPIAGGPAVRLAQVTETEPGVVYDTMRWAPDGSRLYYSYAAPDATDSHNGIWSVAADGSGAHLLTGDTTGGGDAPAVASISPAGDLLLGWYPHRATQFPVRGPILATMGTSTGTTHPIQPPGSLSAPAGFVQMAAFSPDGATLLLFTMGTEPDRQVLLRPTAGGSSVPIVPGGLPFGGTPDYPLMPTWASNGTVFIPGGAELSKGFILTTPG